MLDWHEYVTGDLIANRLMELRAEGAIQRQIAAHRAPREPLRVAIGRALIRVGLWIVGTEPEQRLKASYRRA